MELHNAVDTKRYIIYVNGIVQGVGFRPFIYNVACKNGLKGWVKNKGSMVEIDIEGNKTAIGSFLKQMINEPPQLAYIESIKASPAPPKGYKDFNIVTSENGSSNAAFIPADIAVCDKCMSEVMDKNSSRYSYPFTNCTECGPRYSIIKAFPYDRKNTSMESFRMCEMCKSEYENPLSRRYHAQPNCCKECGPEFWLTDSAGKIIDYKEPLTIAAKLIKSGSIIAIKGIGGFHLCCDAQNDAAIKKLRERKRRPHKPFAVMVQNMEILRKIAELTQKEEEVLNCPSRPIVLLKKTSECDKNNLIAPNNSKIGVMLPYTPLHHIIFNNGLDILIMTSGNISGMPIIYKNDEALQKLSCEADYFLFNNRDIIAPVDDSVVRVVEETAMLSRCGRGYAPMIIPLDSNCDILSAGGGQKSTICAVSRGYAYISQYIGDLESAEALERYTVISNNLTSLAGIRPKVYIHDINPDYISTKYANQQDGCKISVQHHHSHMAACIAEHKITEDVIGIIYDGTGLGTDGAVWGGEFLIGNRNTFKRVAHLKYVKLQGADKIVKEPWRSALCYMCSCDIKPEKYLLNVSQEKIDLVKQALMKDFNCHKSSSMGRFFDCAAAMTGLRDTVTYDAQAAIEFESIIDIDTGDSYSYILEEKPEYIEIDYRTIVRGIAEDIDRGLKPSLISAKFHNTIINFTEECAEIIREKYSLGSVVLSGGVFENAYLLERLCKKLRENNFKVYYNSKVPINDGGLAFGQAAAGSYMEV